MPRTARASVGGVCYHVINRGNARAIVFGGDDDYLAFTALLGRAVERSGMRVLGYCLMPNHIHLVLWPRADGDLGPFMQWLMTAHVRRHHAVHGTSGHLWQGRFKAFPIQADDHLLTVLRYVESNALRARLVRRAENWRWSSLPGRVRGVPSPPVQAGPVPLPGDWVGVVDAPTGAAEIEALRVSVNRGTPFGDVRWTMRTARRLGLEASLRPRGRPRKKGDILLFEKK